MADQRFVTVNQDLTMLQDDNLTSPGPEQGPSTHGSAQTDSLPGLKLWWEQASFEGKPFCNLLDNGALMLKGPAGQPDRELARLNPETADATVRALEDKFQEVSARVAELKAEWSASDDKMKLLGKVTRLRDYLLHANAIGDFESLLDRLDAWEHELNTLTEDHYQKKLKLVEAAEELARAEHWKDGIQSLRELSDQWKESGMIDKQRNDALWNRLEAARQLFYERKRQHQEVQEKEMLQNLDLKMELVEKAEHLANSERWKETTEQFKQLMEEWKSIGRTLPDKNEDLWNRFINAKNVFYDRKKLHFESIQQEQEANYGLKLELVAEAEALQDSTDWGPASQAFAGLMDRWKAIGRVPAEKADELWNRLNQAREHFFSAKRQHFEAFKVSREDNLARKQALLHRAEALQDSNQWREATEELNDLMTEWKKIGPVPREHSDAIWERFLAARTHFFNRKDADREQRRSQVARQLQNRTQQTRLFLQKLEEELKEEQDKLDDFRNGLEHITPGPKEAELRTHLNRLISQSEHKMRHKEEKIAEVRQQLDELERRHKKEEDHPGGADAG